MNIRSILLVFGLIFYCYDAHAQDSPILCKVGNISTVKAIECNIYADNIIVFEVIANRGNCKGSKETTLKYSQVPFFNFIPVSLNKSLKFGDNVVFLIECSNLIEYTLQTNKGDFSWRPR